MNIKYIQAGDKVMKRRTTIELTDEQYFFLKEKALTLQKQARKGSIVSIIRDLIDEDRHKWQMCRDGKVSQYTRG
jgi:hypothetical protein